MHVRVRHTHDAWRVTIIHRLEHGTTCRRRYIHAMIDDNNVSPRPDSFPCQIRGETLLSSDQTLKRDFHES